MIRLVLCCICLFVFFEPLEAQLDVYYAVDQYVLNGQQKDQIEQFLDTLDRPYPYKIYIKGFADASGTKDANLILSKRRADQVTQFLSSRFPNLIDSISFVGLGEIQSDQSERKKHRRVNIQVASAELEKKEGADLPDDLAFEEPHLGYTFELDNIYFKLSKPILLKESYPQLKQLFLWLKKYPTVVVEIQGHVCCSTEADVIAEKKGIRTFGMILSKERAKIICEILEKSGINSNRLKFKGFGFTQPKFYPEETNAHRKGNRRVEVKVIKV